MKRLTVFVLALSACSGRALTLGAGGASGNLPQGSSPTGNAPPGPAVDPTCLDRGTCSASWTLLGSTAVSGKFGVNFAAGLGTRLYFANGSNDGIPQFFRSFDTASGAFADESMAGNPLCDCGYNGVLLPAAGRLFYFGSDADSYQPGGGWQKLARPDEAKAGEPATAVIEGRIYLAGGRGLYDRIATYDPAGDTWTTSGFAKAPTPFDQACAGAFDGKLYVFGGERLDNTQDPMVVLVYDTAADAWSQLPAAANFQGYCYDATAVRWGDRFVYADGSDLGAFQPPAQKWSHLDVPPGLDAFAPAVTDAGDLYLIGYDEKSSDVSIYKMALTGN